ncbi:acyl-CoA thioesterase [Effusibacillus lacus]|uniref:Thioesterase n=1 Tax=Effusibacillus lacus TaxID=1348429 RepID=A0A292YQA2_9BACL|nr:thioesterase family protein [Effusibacillus lacus]TCS70673.1 acyl-CoA thioester hydrolase [Effusibacillus lacus]GAX90670.1 thioesterase [Effusibacillus lacus]
MFEHQIRVGFSDCDALGHVNNAKYYTYMEEARTDIFRIFNPSLDLANWNLIVASTRCDYLEQVKPAETITVISWIGKLGNSSFTVEHALRNQEGNWVARGQATLIHFDYPAQKSAPIPAEARQQLEKHCTGPADAPELR